MIEFLRLCFTEVNFVYSLAFFLILTYWGFFIFGAVGLEAFDVDAGFDAGGLDGIDGGIDGLDGLDGPGLDVDGGGQNQYGGLILPALRWFNAGQVPLMVWVSVLVGAMWSCAIFGTEYFNPNYAVGTALMLLVPNLVISLIVTKLATAPLRQLFRKANQGVAAPIRIVGKTCTVTSGRVDTGTGQAELTREGAPITLNVRCRDGLQLKKGMEAVVVSYDDDKNVYEVVPLNIEGIE